MMQVLNIRTAIVVLTGLAVTACASAPTQRTTLKKVYDRTAQYHAPDRNPIIVIPGILGSKLVDDASGQTVWGAFRADYADPDTDEGARLVALPLGVDGVDHTRNVQPAGVLESLELSLLGFPVKVQAYAGILATLGAGGYRDETFGLNSVDYGTDHYTCFQFDYDWRRDISYNAAELKKFMAEKRLEIQGHYKRDFGIDNAEIKFDIAAHSMGALLTRYYLRYGDSPLPEDGSAPALTWDGAQDVARAVLVAPPNAGALDAFEQLVDGFNMGRPLIPFYEPAIIGTFPAIYQMLPRERHNRIVWDGDKNKPVTNFMDPELWQKYGWGLSARNEETVEVLGRLLPDARNDVDRYALAAVFQKEALNRAKQFHAALDIPASPPAGTELFLVAGDASETEAIISVDSEDGKVSVLEYGVGDSTVLRSSTLMDERDTGEWKPTVQSPIDWSSTLFLPAVHRKITSDPVFEDNVLYWLLEDPR